MTQVLAIFIAVALVIGVLYVLWHPQWAVLVILMMFPLEQLLTAYIPAIGGTRSWILNVAVGVLAVIAVISRVSRAGAPSLGYWNATLYMVLGLYLLATLGLLHSDAADVGLRTLKSGFPYHVLYLGLMPLLLRDLSEVRRVLTGLLFVGIILTVLFLLHPSARYYSGRLVLEQGMYAGQLAGNPLSAATFGCVVALTAVFMRPERHSTVLLLLRSAAFILGVGVALGSGSRGQVLAVAAAGVLCYPLARPVRSPKQFFITAAGLAFAVGLFLLAVKVFVGRENVDRWAVGPAIAAMGTRLDMIRTLGGEYVANPQSWLFGLGTSATADLPGGWGYVHNMVAEIVFEQGVVGAGLLFGIMVTTYLAGRRLFWLYRDDPSLRATVALLCAISVFMFILSLKQGTFLGMPAPFYWWLVLAKIVRYEDLVATAAPEVEPDEGPDLQDAIDEGVLDPSVQGY